MLADSFSVICKFEIYQDTVSNLVIYDSFNEVCHHVQ